MRGHRWFTLVVVLQLFALLLPRGDASPAGAADCAAELEPNDAPETALVFTGAACFTGTAADGDQDIWLWTVPAEAATTRWSFALDGVEGTVSGLKIVEVTSAPGVTPITGGNTLFELSTTPGTAGTVTAQNILFAPGTYILGFSRSGTADGLPPADITYRFSIAIGDPLPANGDAEPNDDAATANPVAGAFALSGDNATSGDFYAWTLSASDAAHGWVLTGQCAVGRSLAVDLLDTTGTVVASYPVDQTGRLVIHDLVFAAGVIMIRVAATSGDRSPYLLQMEPGELPANDQEPNDVLARPSPLAAANPVVTGRLDHDGDRDFFHFTVDDALAKSLFDAKLIWKSQATRQLCLDDARGNQVQCRRGAHAVALTNILLPPGDFYFEISGDTGIDDPYILRLDRTVAPTGTFETEPNDSVALATTMALDAAFAGRFSGTEDDFLRVLVTGDAQLWQLDVAGSGIARASLVDTAGSDQMTADVNADRTHATLSDLFLVPGEHWFRVSGVDGDYTVTLTPLGPPDPNGEREPNNGADFAEPLALGVARTGRLVQLADADVFRFSLAARDHLTIDLTPPTDGAVAIRVEAEGNVDVMNLRTPPLGQTVSYDADLLPGDYEIWLTPVTPSAGKYELLLTRDDPFTLAADQEPNDEPAFARPFPATLSVSGTAGQFGDDDWYLLPTLATAGGITATASGVTALNLTDGTTSYPLAAQADGTTFVSDRLPADVAFYLRVSANGPYTVALAIPGVMAAAAAPKLNLTATLTAETNTVAAYWQAGQTVAGTLTLRNGGLLNQTVTLEAVTSHFAWSVALVSTPVEVPRVSSVSVPVTIRILPDAWADVPVRITVRAANAQGGFTTAFVEITPGREAAPVHPAPAWSVPAALLGGLDVAALGLGAKVIPTIDEAGEAALHDGVTPDGGGFHISSGATFPIVLTVDLAGDDPAPVAGIILNPQGADLSLHDLPRGFDLLLSDDGVTFTPALSGELSPLAIDQAFVLPKPVGARFAQLRITSTYAVPPYAVALGEWKVIATPGYVPGGRALNIADPGLGGHIVFMDPQAQLPDFASAMLTQNGERDYLTVAAGVRPTWVAGFAHDRAARITGLRWIDPTGSTPETRMHRVTIEVSTTSPLGPWTLAGTWELTRAVDGTVASFTFDQPIWARFVRFTADGPGADKTDWEYPDAIQVIERASGDDYRSVFGEWGQNAPVGPYEWENPPQPGAIALDKGDNTAATAQPLAVGVTVSDQVHIGTDVDWYTVSAPPGQNTLSFTVTGGAYVGVKVTLWDETGTTQLPLTFAPAGGDLAATIYTATVTPGVSYTVKVEQPTHSVVVAFDTSISLGAYQPYVQEGLRAFAGSIRAGEEYVNVMPFEEQPLLDHWSDQGYEVQSAINSYANSSSSSSAETALIDSSQILANQEGARAILLVTDAETSSYAQSAELWKLMGSVRPIIFAVHVGGANTPVMSRHFMEDWAAAGGGYYQYTRSHGEMDRAYDRLATWLRRPASYTLAYTASFQEAGTPTPVPTTPPEPTSTPAPTPSETVEPSATPAPTATVEAGGSVRNGSLQVVAAAQSENGHAGTTSAGSGVAVEIILDTSGSMLQQLEGGRSRIDIAKSVLVDLVTNQLPAGAPVALRVFGSEPGSCDTTLASPLQPLDGQALATRIDNIQVVNLVKTPIGFALQQVANDLADAPGPKVVVLVTDGEETCGGDPKAAIAALVAMGIDVQVNIVGFALDTEQLKATLAEWARAGHGSYYDATNAAELSAAIAKAASAPYRVYDQAGNLVASGTVGGPAIKLKPGTYTVVVLTDPVGKFEQVVITAGKKTKLTI